MSFNIRSANVSREQKWKIRRYAKPILKRRERRYPGETRCVWARQLGWKLLEAAGQYEMAKTAAFIRFVREINLPDALGMNFLHKSLRWTLDQRPKRFPKKNAHTALEKIDRCSTGMLPRDDVRTWINRCGHLPDSLNGRVMVGIRCGKGGHNRTAYKNMIFQSALYNTAQFERASEQAIEMTILSYAVNLWDQDPVKRQIRYLKQIR